MDRIGVERLCLFGMPPVEFVNLAADLDCGFIGVGFTPMRGFNPHGYRDWSLRTDAQLRRETKTALADRGVEISLFEGFGLTPGGDARDYAGDLDIVAELGGRRVNVVSMDKDLARTLDGFAKLAEMAEARGIETVIEIGPGPINGVEPAMAAVRHVGRPTFGLLIDTMHFFRFGGTVAQAAALEPGAIGYVQLCDAPRVSTHASYMDEALHERLPPGAGELPLRELIGVLPREVVLSVEVPQRSLAAAGVSPRERVGACVAAARRLVAEAFA